MENKRSTQRGTDIAITKYSFGFRWSSNNNKRRKNIIEGVRKYMQFALLKGQFLTFMSSKMGQNKKDRAIFSPWIVFLLFLFNSGHPFDTNIKYLFNIPSPNKDEK